MKPKVGDLFYGDKLSCFLLVVRLDGADKPQKDVVCCYQFGKLIRSRFHWYPISPGLHGLYNPNIWKKV